MSKKQEKKSADAEPRLILGRPTNHVKIGIVGLPNVGKSSFFNLLSNLVVPAENYPFCTIDPNVAIVSVPDERFDALVKKYQPASAVAAQLTVTDIAGLVRGAAEGQGLGNAFLSHIRAVDAIYHVVRVFEDEDVIHVEASVDPVRDLDIISEELRKKDLEFIVEKVESLSRVVARGQDKSKKAELDTAQKVDEWLKQGNDVRYGNWSNKDIEFLNQWQLLSAKPMVYLVNMSERDFIRQKNKWLKRIQDWVRSKCSSDTIIPFSVAYEQKLMAEIQAGVPPPEEKKEEKKAEEGKEAEPNPRPVSQLPKIVKTGYHALNLCHFFTCGADEVKCWTIRRGTKAPQAAGTIHTDFERGFVCAEVMTYGDLMELGDEGAVRAAGKYLMQGKNYVVQDGDIIYFKANTSSLSSSKKK